MQTHNSVEIENKYASGVYFKRDVTIVKGKGSKLWDQNGREYIDCVAGQGVATLGHSHPKIISAIKEQSEKLIVCTEIFYNDVRAQLLEKLIHILPANINRAYLCNSGAEAVESALKFARLATGKNGVIATMRGFHGRTMGALATTWEKKYREPFEPLISGVKHVPYNKIDRIKNAMDDSIGAIIVEIVQGEGGVYPGTKEYFTDLRKLCNNHGCLLIVDEVQTGFGRTGKWFACEHHSLEPDMITMGKAIAGGIPMGAVGLSDRVTGLEPGTHGSTFGGNPLACAAAVATIDIYKEEHIIDKSAESGVYFQQQLSQIDSPLIREVRGLGMIIGMELKTKVRPILSALMDKGLFALPAGLTVLRFLPPLNISKEEIDQVVAITKDVLKELEQTKE